MVNKWKQARVIGFYCILYILSLIFANHAFADGSLTVFDPVDQQWQLQSMNKQVCAIHCENGRENMLLSIYLNDFYGTKGLWIFPVPAKPDKVEIKYTKSFPAFEDKNIVHKAEESMRNVFSSMRLSQLYTLPSLDIHRRALKGSLRNAADLEGMEGVKVYEHIEKSGLTTELITSSNGESLKRYLNNKEILLPDGLIKTIDEYIGKEYSFVVSWISDIEKFKAETIQKDYLGHTFNSIGLLCRFPSEKGFFPLRLTSVYGNEYIPMTVYVSGYVTPEIFSGIKKDIVVQYSEGNIFVNTDDNELASFFNKSKLETFNDNQKFTIIVLNSQSKNLTQDLWIDLKAPKKITYLQWVKDYSFIWGWLLFIFISGLSSLLSGVLVFRIYHPQLWRLFLFGLTNVLTLTGLAIAAHRIEIDRKFTSMQETSKPKWSLFKASAILFLSAIILAIIFTVFLAIRLFIVFHENIFNNSYFFQGLMLFSIVFYILLSPIIFIISNNKLTRRFIILFSLIFIFLTFLTQSIFIWIYQLL